MINLKLFKIKGKIKSSHGFVIPFTLLVCAIILSVSTGISLILAKELYFSKLSRDSQDAYYAADNGLMCAIAIDDAYIDPDTGSGIFQYSNLNDASAVLNKVNEERALKSFNALNLYGGNSIKCATSEIFDPITNSFKVDPYQRENTSHVTEYGKSSSFMLHMNLGDGTTRCAKVIVNKTGMYRQIISQGYAECLDTRSKYPVERAVVSETEVK
ncbi:MAG: hypothetical protein WCK60_00880 [Candidatus Nomurabacteria bacterium]